MTTPFRQLLTPPPSPPPTWPGPRSGISAVDELEKMELFYEDLNAWVHRACGALFEAALAQSEPGSPTGRPVALPASPHSPTSVSEPAALRSTTATPMSESTSSTLEDSSRSPPQQYDAPMVTDTAPTRHAVHACAVMGKGDDVSAPAADLEMVRQRKLRAAALRRQQRILLLFGDLVHSRLESCARMKKIMRKTGRYNARAG